MGLYLDEIVSEIGVHCLILAVQSVDSQYTVKWGDSGTMGCLKQVFNKKIVQKSISNFHICFYKS